MLFVSNNYCTDSFSNIRLGSHSTRSKYSLTEIISVDMGEVPTSFCFETSSSKKANKHCDVDGIICTSDSSSNVSVLKTLLLYHVTSIINN